jgi:hypothetical protein
MRLYVLALVVLLGVGFGLQLSAEDSLVRSNSEPSAQTDEQKAVVIDPADETGPTIKTDRMLTEEEAQELVWNLPEVQTLVVRILDQGGVPLSMVGFRPSRKAQPGADKAFYTIHFQGERVKEPMPETIFCVDAFTGQIRVYEKSSGKILSLDDWRHQRK